MKSANEYTRKELFNLPYRGFNYEDKPYDSVLIMPGKGRHDSGWQNICIIGCRDRKPVEICTMCSDDIEWKMTTTRELGEGLSFGLVRTDMAFEAKALHLWSGYGVFHVGAPCSSTSITFIPQQ